MQPNKHRSGADKTGTVTLPRQRKLTGLPPVICFAPPVNRGCTALIPDGPTMRGLGYAGFTHDALSGLSMLKGTPAPSVATMNLPAAKGVEIALNSLSLEVSPGRKPGARTLELWPLCYEGSALAAGYLAPETWLH